MDEDIFILILTSLCVLAIIDLVVGVSNDAVNFLNSALGSKAISIKKILVIASLGIAIGAITSSGLMEVARKGIFIPSEFYFNEIMYIFTAVIITDIFLLDVFNTLGMPTSTTVSIVFELLGASVATALIKISANNTKDFSQLGTYINSEKALEIIMGILLSIVFAFILGAIVQFISRLIYSFNFEKRPKYIGGLFGGLAMTAITYFIIIKGLKGVPYYSRIQNVIEDNTIFIILASFLLWLIFSFIYTLVLKKNILILIIGIGTFSLAMAFAGNDLVNFIGVPIAALFSYQAWSKSGVPASEFTMNALEGKVEAPAYLLLFSGIVMITTIWFSKKARTVIETGINLSRQSDGHERFQPNNISRAIVRGTVSLVKAISYISPKSINKWIDSRFAKPVIKLPKDKTYEMPAFDLVRASVNLMMAAILISIGTSIKLPLSTTYVTFMVAMGTSLADRAWGRESAVYRIAGVVNVIGGWFITAMLAFISSAILAFLIHLGGIVAIAVLLILVFFVLGKNYINVKKKSKEEKIKLINKNVEYNTIKGVVDESSDHIAEVLSRVTKMYRSVVDDLALQNLDKLKKTDKHVNKLNAEVDELRNNVFYFIKSLDDKSVEASRFYIMVLGYLQDITQSIDYMAKASFKHVNNNHKSLKKGQIKDLKLIHNDLKEILEETSDIFEERKFNLFVDINTRNTKLSNELSYSIERQISRIRSDETSPKNSSLYFSILLETKDMMSAIVNLIKLYEEFYVNSKIK